MKEYFALSIIVCAILVVSGKTSTNSNSVGNEHLLLPRVSGGSETNVLEYDVFNWNLCKALHDNEKNNAVISSISVKLVLLVLYEGALGDTANQIERVLGLTGHKQQIRSRYSQKLQSLQSHGKDDYELDVGTKLFMDKSVSPKYGFTESITKWYNASYEILDFSKSINAVNSINQWAENITHGRIQQLVTEAQTKENVVLLLLNAIFFKGSWTNKFNKELTRSGTFYLNSTDIVSADLMTIINNFNTSYIETLNSRLISLPYQGNKFVMYIILPNSVNGLTDLVKKINPSILSESIKDMKTVLTKVVLPKFKFEYTSILGPILKKLGIIDMFDSNSNLTDLGNSSFGSLIVSNVLQKAGIEVNEEGSVAVAATVAELGNRFGGMKYESTFEVNRPFLFMIEDITMNTILFVGQVTNPHSQGIPIVSIPIDNSPTQTKPISDGLESKINLEQQDINFLPFTYFDTEIFQELSQNYLDTNFVSSPASIKSILALLSEGAQGDTLKQLNVLLRLPKDQSSLHNLMRINQLSMKSSIIDLVASNNIFVKNKNSISNYFQDTANTLYSAYISEINLKNIDESIKIINEQISHDTKGIINNVISKDDFDGNTELLLANVLYFKGNWLMQFDENNTQIESFCRRPTDCAKVKMMNLESQLRYSYVAEINAQAIELLYEDKNFSMLILLPDENISYIQFINNFKHNPITKIINLLRQRNVNLYLPKFTLKYSTKLSAILKKMGLTSIFDRNANLSSIFNPEKQVFVKDVTHKATIEINEKGSTATATTVISVVPLSSIPQLPVVTVNINRPFAFFIINRNTKNTLFSGHIHQINASATTLQAMKNGNPSIIPTSNVKRQNSQNSDKVIYKN